MERGRRLYYDYALDIVEGVVPSCVYVREACARFISDMEREDLEFREECADKAIEFIATLKHFTGKSSGTPFLLEPFQAFIVANLIGWYRKADGLRRFTSAYIEMARKGGKTALIAALAMYYFIADGEDNAEIDIAANNYDQAKICFSFIQQYSRQLDPKGKHLKVWRSSVDLDTNASRVNVFSSDDKGKDGFNASVGIIDEYHSARNSKMRDVIKSSMGMRENPMLLTITSAGFDKSLPCYKLRTTCTEILAGLKSDDSLFAIIFTLDEEDDWRDPSVWIKANPNLGKTVTEKFLVEQVNAAKNNPTEEVSVRTKNLGQWLTTNEIWIPERYIEACSADIDLEDFEDEDAYVGVDLGATSDLTAVCYMMPRDDKFYFKVFYYAPESALDDSPNRDQYRLWKRQGMLITTPGNVTDYQAITNRVYEQYNKLFLRKIFYDPWNAVRWVSECTDIGLPMESYTQNLANFNRPTKEFERLCRGGNVVLDNNDITRWMFSNVTLKFDHNGNCKPDKGAGKDKKIDGVVAILTALGGYLLHPGAAVGVY